MDVRILEFWGNVFLSAARSQQKMEELNKLFGGNAGVDNPITDAINKSYGWLGAKNADPEEIINIAVKTAGVFQNFLKSYFMLFDVISKDEYVKLMKENEELKEKIIQQEKIIDDLKSLPGKAFEQGEIVSGFTQILEKQARHFQELMTQLSQYNEKNTTIEKNKPLKHRKRS
jgi:hypothetical protein